MGTEIELRLVTSRSGMRRATALPWLRKLANGKTERQHLSSVYFDTSEGALHARGVSLRVRKIGERRLQTIKADAGGALDRAEWETEIDRDRPRLELADRTALAPLLTGKLTQRLKPVFETEVERTVMPLSIGESEIELAFDAGRVATTDASVDISAIEIELKHGETRAAAQLARRLARTVPVTFAPRAKAEWGYALLDGTIEAPRFAEPVRLEASCTAGQAFAVIGFACLRQIAGNEYAVRSGDGEGVHQMRVGLRRLRAALSLFKDMLQGREVRHIKRELKWLTAQMGPARDHDVFLSETVGPFRQSEAAPPEFEALAHDLDAARRAGFAHARAAVGSERYHRLLLDCALWLLDGAWRADNDPLRRAIRERAALAFAHDELDRRTRRIVRRAKKLARLDTRRRHKLRIAVKKVRYGREFFASLKLDRRRKTGRRIDRALKGLQGALGALNDMRAHDYWGRNFARESTASRKAFAIGYLRGCEDSRAKALLSKALGAGKELRKAA